MGSDLSVVFRTCVPAPHAVCGMLQHQSGSSGVTEGGSDQLILYNELRLVEGNSFSPDSLLSFLTEKVEVPLRLITTACAPQVLSTLNLEDTTKFSFLHEGLRCEKCAGRIGFAVDPSVRIGQRLYSAEQRHVFTQSLSIFLYKLALVMKSNIIAFQGAGDGCTENDIPNVGDLVNTPCKRSVMVRHELFLLDLQHGLLDNVSGPWIVRDFVDHMGRVEHYHSAVSLLCRPSVSSTISPSAVQETGSSVESLPSGCMLDHISTSKSCNDARFLVPDTTQLDFCRSLRHVILSNNNMSLIGLRKCILELVNHSERDNQATAKFLQTIDVRQNEESTAAQRLAAEMTSFTGVNVLIGTSGKRWRYRSMYLANDSISRASVRSVSLTHSIYEYNPKRVLFPSDATEDRQGDSNEEVPAPWSQEKQSPSDEKNSSSHVTRFKDSVVPPPPSPPFSLPEPAGVVAGANLRPNREEKEMSASHEEYNRTEAGHFAASVESEAALKAESPDTEMKGSLGDLIMLSSSLTKSENAKQEMNEGQLYSAVLDVAGDAKIVPKAARHERLINAQKAARADFPAAGNEKSRNVPKHSVRQNYEAVAPMNNFSDVQFDQRTGVQSQSLVNKTVSSKRGSTQKMAATTTGAKTTKTSLADRPRPKLVQHSSSR